MHKKTWSLFLVLAAPIILFPFALSWAANAVFKKVDIFPDHY